VDFLAVSENTPMHHEDGKSGRIFMQPPFTEREKVRNVKLFT
jgi:hypothetical protein